MEKLVQKFLENRCTPEEAEQVLQWLQTEQGEAFLNQKLKKDHHRFFNSDNSAGYPGLDSAELFREIQNKKNSAGSSGISRKRRRNQPSRFFTWLPPAAAAVILFVIMMTFNLNGEQGFEETEATRQVFQTERGEQKTIRLGDGSRVILNHESLLSVPDTFSETNRQLILEGEAWFEVVSLESHPFQIETGNGIVRVLGTSFSVTSHPGEQSTRVVVAEGKVSLGARSPGSVRETIIEKDQSGLLREGEEIELRDVQNLEPFTGWKDGKLVFHNTPFGDVVRRLERWYDIECIITDTAILEENFTSVFEDEPLKQVLDIIALSMNIQYELEHQTVIFKTNNR